MLAHHCNGLVIVRHVHTEGGNQDLAHETRKFIKSLNFLVTMELSSTGARCLTSALTFGWDQFKLAQASLV